MLGKKYGVFGVGKYGTSIAKKLVEKGAEVHAFDCNESKIENIKDDVAFSVTLDATDRKALKAQNVEEIDTAVVAIGENFEAVILTAVNLMEMKVPRIIARASGPNQKVILEKIGINEILTPEEEVAFVVVERLINPSVVNFLQLPDNYEIAEIIAPKNITERKVGEIGLRDKYSLTMITIKRAFEIAKKGEVYKEEHIIGVPTSDTVIKESDTLVIFGTTQDVARFIEINK